MTPPRFLLDEHVPQAIQSQLLRLEAEIDVLVVGQPLAPPKGTWDLWRRRQQLTSSDTESARARLAVETHLARIAQHRPLTQIKDPGQRAEVKDPGQRAEAEQVRAWFVEEFLNVLK